MNVVRSPAMRKRKGTSRRAVASTKLRQKLMMCTRGFRVEFRDPSFASAVSADGSAVGKRISASGTTEVAKRMNASTRVAQANPTLGSSWLNARG
jgi:hypothetical protein